MKNKILVIEDEKGIRDNLNLLLMSENFEVETAANGKSGIDKAYTFKPDLIICDIMLPDIDGYQILETLSNDSNFDLVPFVFLTAKVEKQDLRKGMNLGADDYLFKPFDADDLLSSVKKRLQKYEQLKASVEIKENEINKGKNDKLVFKVGDNSYPVFIKNILFITADKQYSNVHTLNKKRYIIKRSLNQWEEILPENLFIRIHRATLINSEYINKIEKVDGQYKVHINNSSNIFEVSRRFYKNLKSL